MLSSSVVRMCRCLIILESVFKEYGMVLWTFCLSTLILLMDYIKPCNNSLSRINILIYKGIDLVGFHICDSGDS